MITLEPTNQQNLACTHCGVVTLTDGTQVWVCKSCGQPNQPADTAAPSAMAGIPAEPTVTPPPMVEPTIPTPPVTEPVPPVTPEPGTDQTK